jgi:ABC-type lipoprotein release transport system permease subunit
VGVAADDLAAWSGAGMLLALTALAATLLPAWRATRVDPLGAIRAE